MLGQKIITSCGVNKPTKEYLKRFEEWYSKEVTNQLHGSPDVESLTLEPVDMCFARMKKLTACWLVEMADYVLNNPKFIFNGFVRSGITCVLDGHEDNFEIEEDNPSVGDEHAYLSSDCD